MGAGRTVPDPTQLVRGHPQQAVGRTVGPGLGGIVEDAQVFDEPGVGDQPGLGLRIVLGLLAHLRSAAQRGPATPRDEAKSSSLYLDAVLVVQVGGAA